MPWRRLEVEIKALPRHLDAKILASQRYPDLPRSTSEAPESCLEMPRRCQNLKHNQRFWRLQGASRQDLGASEVPQGKFGYIREVSRQDLGACEAP